MTDFIDGREGERERLRSAQMDVCDLIDDIQTQQGVPADERLDLCCGYISSEAINHLALILDVDASTFAKYLTLKYDPMLYRFFESPSNMADEEARLKGLLTVSAVVSSRKNGTEVMGPDVKVRTVHYAHINICPAETDRRCILEDVVKDKANEVIEKYSVPGDGAIDSVMIDPAFKNGLRTEVELCGSSLQDVQGAANEIAAWAAADSRFTLNM